MSKVVRSSPMLFWLLVGFTILTGFIHWGLMILAAFVGGFLFKREAKIKRPVIAAALSATLGWLLTAFARDLLEGGRISSRLASFLSLPHGVFTYVVLFLICFLPALFGALSGVAFAVWIREIKTQSSPASGK